jgi:hypothetical protein
MRRSIAIATIATFMAAPAVGDDVVLYQRPAGVTLIDSKYGAIADLQKALLAAATSCGLPQPADPVVMGRYQDSTSRLVRDVAHCRNISLPDASGNAVTAELWRAVLPSLPPPDAGKRAWAMSFKFEGTDYDVVEFNVGTSDPGILTWGPLGATAGQAFQVQRILSNIDRMKPSLIDQAFAAEASQIRVLMTKRTIKSATDFITSVDADPGRKAIWSRGFAALGADRDARRIYDDLMSASATAGVPEAVADFYRAYWSHCIAPTEVDYGFFFDRAVQINVTSALVNAAYVLVERAQQKSGRTFTHAERRRAFAANYTAGNPKFVGDRLARDVGYYIDAIGESSLTDASLLAIRTSTSPLSPQLNNEYLRWSNRSSFKAGFYGLSDNRVMPAPQLLTGSVPACLRSRYAKLGRRLIEAPH